VKMPDIVAVLTLVPWAPIEHIGWFREY